MGVVLHRIVLGDQVAVPNLNNLPLWAIASPFEGINDRFHGISTDSVINQATAIPEFMLDQRQGD